MVVAGDGTAVVVVITLDGKWYCTRVRVGLASVATKNTIFNTYCSSIGYVPAIRNIRTSFCVSVSRFGTWIWLVPKRRKLGRKKEKGQTGRVLLSFSRQTSIACPLECRVRT